MAEAVELAEALNEVTDRRDVLAEQFDKIEEQPSQAERARDEAGKFTAKPAEKPEKAAKPKPTEAAPAAEIAAVEPPWKAKPPQSWKKDYHEVWQTLPDNVREYTHQREEQMKAGVQPLLGKAEFADTVNQVVEPYLNTIKGLGLTVPQVLKGFFEADNILRHSPPQTKLAYIQQLAQSYGIDLGPLRGTTSQAPAIDPNYHALQNQLVTMEGRIRTWQEQQEAAQNQVLQGEIEQFAQAHEHFETVRPIMASLLQSGQAKTLDEAYKKAVRLDDTLFESEVKARQAETSETKDKAAKSARAAAVSVRGSTPGSNTATKAKTRHEVLSEQFDGIDSRL